MSNLIGVFTCDLRPDVPAAEFEFFMRSQLLPAYRNLPGCLEANLLRMVKGDGERSYASISRWESAEANDAVFEPEGQLSAEYSAAQERLGEFVTEARWVGYTAC